jgi:hypothetical protein
MMVEFGRLSSQIFGGLQADAAQTEASLGVPSPRYLPK